MKGYVHSIQSLGAVDGPGVRSVVFMQGCSLRCVYCHNPDTWKICNTAPEQSDAAENRPGEYTPEELVNKLLRFKPYFGKEGGVTISGGEPLLQADFVAEVFRLLWEKGIHTALDTAGQIVDKRARKVLKYTNLALVDLKFLTEREYQIYAKGSRQKVDEFLEMTGQMEVPVWIRHVLVEGFTDNDEYLRKTRAFLNTLRNVQRVEVLPYHSLGAYKWRELGLTYPLENTAPPSPARLKNAENILCV